VEIPGTVEAFAQADLYSMVSGYITEAKVDMGDAVGAALGCRITVTGLRKYGNDGYLAGECRKPEWIEPYQVKSEADLERMRPFFQRERIANLLVTVQHNVAGHSNIAPSSKLDYDAGYLHVYQKSFSLNERLPTVNVLYGFPSARAAGCWGQYLACFSIIAGYVTFLQWPGRRRFTKKLILTLRGAKRPKWRLYRTLCTCRKTWLWYVARSFYGAFPLWLLWTFIVVQTGMVSVLRIRLGMEDFDGAYVAATLLLLPLALLLTGAFAWTASNRSIPCARRRSLYMLGVQCFFFLPQFLIALLNVDPQRNMNWILFWVVHAPVLIAMLFGTRCYVLLFGSNGRRIAEGEFYESVMAACVRMGIKVKRVLLTDTAGWGNYRCDVSSDGSLWVTPDLLRFSREDVDAFVVTALWQERRRTARHRFLIGLSVFFLFMGALSIVPNANVVPILIMSVVVALFGFFSTMKFQERDAEVANIIGGAAYLRSLRSFNRVFPLAGATRDTDAITLRAQRLVFNKLLEEPVMKEILTAPPGKNVVSYLMPAFASAKVWYPF